jgi:Flp pilus assembly pilin Flp
MDKIYALMTALYTGMYDREESEDRGAGMVEYALLVALVGVTLTGVLGLLAGGIDNAFDAAIAKLPGGG